MKLDPGMPGICLVVPCYNEQGRLSPSTFMEAAGLRFVFVNDGSTDGTGLLLDDMESEDIEALHLERNRGKAEAVRVGMLHVLSQEYCGQLDWIGFWDADLSTPLPEVETLIGYCRNNFPDAEMVFGSRVKKSDNMISRSASRHLVGRCFAALFAVLLGVQTYDSQCGAKLFRKSTVKKLFTEPFLSRWLFDVELILRAGGRGICECPLREWSDPGASKIGFTDSIGILRDLLRIYFHYGRLKRG